MNVTQRAAEEEFLQFVDYYAAITSASPEEYHEMGYRIDTWQMWARCDGGTHGPEPFSCKNPGLYVQVNAPQAAPFEVKLGPYVLKKFDAVDDAFAACTSEISKHIQLAVGHQHVFDQPHHETCTVCLPDEAV